MGPHEPGRKMGLLLCVLPLVWRGVELELRGWRAIHWQSGLVFKKSDFLFTYTSILGTLALVQECGQGRGPEWGHMYCVTSDESLNISVLRLDVAQCQIWLGDFSL